MPSCTSPWVILSAAHSAIAACRRRARRSARVVWYGGRDLDGAADLLARRSPGRACPLAPPRSGRARIIQRRSGPSWGVAVRRRQFSIAALGPSDSTPHWTALCDVGVWPRMPAGFADSDVAVASFRDLLAGRDAHGVAVERGAAVAPLPVHLGPSKPLPASRPHAMGLHRPPDRPPPALLIVEQRFAMGGGYSLGVLEDAMFARLEEARASSVSFRVHGLPGGGELGSGPPNKGNAPIGAGPGGAAGTVAARELGSPRAIKASAGAPAGRSG